MENGDCVANTAVESFLWKVKQAVIASHKPSNKKVLRLQVEVICTLVHCEEGIMHYQVIWEKSLTNRAKRKGPFYLFY